MIRICGVVRESIVDGPGFRYTLFVQGCPHGCEGCHNPQTHDFNGGKEVSAEAMKSLPKRYWRSLRRIRCSRELPCPAATPFSRPGNWWASAGKSMPWVRT